MEQSKELLYNGIPKELIGSIYSENSYLFFFSLLGAGDKIKNKKDESLPWQSLLYYRWDQKVYEQVKTGKDNKL